MPATSHWIAFALVALGLVLTPGPNMIYLVSRTLCQGRAAGLLSLIGTAGGFLFYMLCTVFGITALVMAVPYAYDSLRLAGAAYLLYLSWQALKPGGRSPFQARQLPPDRPRRLIAMGFLTNLLNPKAAVLYLSLLPQFADPAQGSMLGQLLVLGFTQMAVSLPVNALIVLSAGTIARHLQQRPVWQRLQRWMMGGVLGALAVRMAVEQRR
jgi:threonine/homoserine/homoserine lactone efflux protein